MSNPMIRIHDVESGEIIDREMTAEEAAAYEATAAAYNALVDANKAREASSVA